MKDVTIYDAVTKKITQRDFTDNEIADREQMQAEYEAEIAVRQAKASARVSALAKLADLGLTAEEIAAL
jgi:hypothetical protein